MQRPSRLADLQTAPVQAIVGPARFPVQTTRPHRRFTERWMPHVLLPSGPPNLRHADDFPKVPQARRWTQDSQLRVTALISPDHVVIKMRRGGSVG